MEMKNKMIKWLFLIITISICSIGKVNISEAAAVYYKVTYQVNYDSFTNKFNGLEGTLGTSYETVRAGSEYHVTNGIPMILEDDGTTKANFMGWSYTRSGDVEVRPGENLGVLKSDITLYPVYSKDSQSPKVMFFAYKPSGEHQEVARDTIAVKENCYFDYLDYSKPFAAGYEFIGWSVGKDNTVELGTDGPYLNDFATGTGIVSLNAAWLPKQHDIVFDANGGTFSDASTSVTRQARSYKSLDISDLIPTRENYVFIGWGLSKTSTSVEHTTTYYEDTLVYMTQNRYAVWAPKEYTITYNANGGTGAPEKQTQAYDKTVIIPSKVPVREGYDFFGWACKVTGYTAHYNAGQSFKRASHMGTSATIEFTAEWRIKKYTVTYDLNGGVAGSGPASQSKTHNTVLELSTLQPYHEHGTFLGWATSKNATKANMGSQYSVNADITLYAVWDLKQYTITFDENGGYYGPVSADKTYGKAMIIPNVVPEREGYTFLGWATSKTATTPTYKVGSSYTTEGDATLYAVWRKGTTVTPSGPVSQTITTKVTDIVYKKNKKVSLGAKTNGGGTLSYKSSNKKVATINTKGKLTIKSFGKTVITVTAAANGNYLKTTKKFTIRVVPNKVTLSKVTSTAKKTITSKWKKEKNASGYQMYISTKKNFKKETYERTYKKSNTSAKLTGLKKGRTYYVKIRAYKTVKGKKYYGPWSTVKKVKIK